MSSPTVRGSRIPAPARLFLVVLCFSLVGDEIALLALTFRLAETGQGVWVSALLLAQLIPMVVVPPLVGPRVDRFDGGRVLGVITAVQGVALLPIILFPTPVVMVGGFLLVSVLAAAALPALLAILPVLARESVSTSVNAAYEGVRSLAALTGPVVAGALLAAVSLRLCLVIDAISFVMAGLCVLAMRVSRPGKASDGTDGGAAEGIRALWRVPSLRALLPLLAITVSAMSTVNVALVFLVRGPLGGGEMMFGILSALWGAGLLGGSVIVARTRWGARGPERVVGVGALTTGVGLSAVGLFPVIAVAVPALVLAGVGNALVNVSLRTAVQLRTPATVHGRTHAAMAALIASFFVVGLLLGGLSSVETAGPVFLLGGLTVTISAAGGLLAPLVPGLRERLREPRGHGSEQRR
ncbi:MFS transporter [Nocardiopsis alba]|jgi:MFS family permease|uniref:MFS transporter n=1 Tax=Nocardiopsis alba TaxID=53437 RepID=UPI0033C7D861